MNLVYEKVRHEGNQGDRDHHGNNGLGECQLGLGEIAAAVAVTLLIPLENLGEDGVVRVELEAQVANLC